MSKRHLEGPGWCPLCRADSESILHLLIQCPFTGLIWKEASAALHQDCVWEGISIEEAWRSWLQNRDYRKIKALPLLIGLGAWLARNAAIFKDRPSLLEILAVQALSILSHFPQEKDHPAIYIVQPDIIDQSRPWAFFDGVSQNNNQNCSGGALLFLSPQTLFSLKDGSWFGLQQFC
jgi:hypothetical protein